MPFSPNLIVYIYKYIYIKNECLTLYEIFHFEYMFGQKWSEKEMALW